MRFYGPLLLILLLGTCAAAQERNGMTEKSARIGILDLEVLDGLLYTVPGVAAPADAIRHNVKAYMMPIRRAPAEPLEWAYALTSVLEYYRNLGRNFKDNLSPDFLQLSLANRGKRPNVEDGLNFLVREGTVSASIVAYESTLIPGAVHAVPKVKIANFGYLFREETRPRNRNFELRKALSRGNPVLIEVRTMPGFDRHTGETYRPTQPLTERHFLTVVGFDSSEETYEVRGTFGHTWGTGGYTLIGFEDLAEMARQGFVLIPLTGAAAR